jgi:copper chaperone NosL
MDPGVHFKIIRKALFGIIILLTASFVHAGSLAPRKHTNNDKCPVCGMFIYKYPDFIAQVVFQDETVHFFDGSKDMFKYLFAIDKYTPGKKSSGIASMYVTEYYRLTPIDAQKAYYVMGSDVYGPMGKELIPFEKKSDADEFLKDHHGKMMLRYQDITSLLIMGLE